MRCFMKQNNNLQIDRISFELGMINCFVEMVACGVKELAISPPIKPEEYNIISQYSDEIVAGFGIKSYLEKFLLITDLQSDDFTKGKWSILYYREDVTLKKYFQLKQENSELEAAGNYQKKNREKISREFMKLLSYPEEIIKEKLSQTKPKDPFILTDDN